MKDTNFITRLRELPPRRWVGMLVGNLVLALGISILKWSHTGNDPYSGMVMAVASVLGTTYGRTLIITNCFLFLVELILGRKYIGVGTIGNWFLLGPVVDCIYPFWIRTFHEADMIWKQLVLAVIGVIVISIGCSLYQTSDAGISPYDSLALIVENRTPLPYFWSRMICDALCALICFLAHGVMGIGMVICAFGLGPIISFFDKYLSVPVLLTKRKREGDAA